MGSGCVVFCFILQVSGILKVRVRVRELFFFGYLKLRFTFLVAMISKRE